MHWQDKALNFGLFQLWYGISSNKRHYLIQIIRKDKAHMVYIRRPYTYFMEDKSGE